MCAAHVCRVWKQQRTEHVLEQLDAIVLKVLHHFAQDLGRPELLRDDALGDSSDRSVAQ